MKTKEYLVKPFYVLKEVFNKKDILYLISSSNSYTFHHCDNNWRIRRLNDERKYTYKSKRKALSMCKLLMNELIIF